MTQNLQPQARFSELGIAPKLLDNLERLKFVVPTPIQHQCIPQALQGKDIVGIAQTGTGKTLAFGIPMIQILSQMPGNAQGLILLPTRELALQVDQVLQTIGRPIGLRTAVLIGGASGYQQKQMLRRGPHIIVSTPGRLMDHVQQKNLTLTNMKIVVLDEADRMFDIGFMPQIKQILAMISKERQTLMFSATMPQAISEIAHRYMKIPLRIEVAPAGTSAKNVEQEIFIVNKDAKMQLLEKVLEDNKGSVLLFSRTKHGAKRIANGVRAMGHTASEIHSNKSLSQRKMALEGFKTGRFRVLVATDIASRGIDVTGISLVINYDLPDNTEDYVHRIGRTGRAQSFGKAISFATSQEWVDIRHIEKLIKKTIPVRPLPVLPPRRSMPAEHYEETSGFQGRGRSGGRGGYQGNKNRGGQSEGNKNFRRRY
ncbi:MAG: ATP-dependent RNA helicase RhlE [Parcubacteria group bacterium Gr01-1014_13]|nr:MAG: ATP-dependent RNA helicase RhlE [Parcubacteria group bacterium Gr01-1014_13]